MSWDYTYYICRKNREDGKLYPFGPFDYKGEFYYVLSRSRSFASDLHESFRDIQTEADRQIVSEELLKAVHSGLSDEDYKEFYEGGGYYCWSYLHYSDLPKGSYIKKGYCLIEDIKSYEDEDGYFDGFYDWLTPEIYAKKLENELKFGAPKPVKDEFGEEYTPHSMREYSFFRWADYESPEYESSVIRQAFGIMRSYYSTEMNDEEIFILLVQG